jgi:general secretion pathway protein D
VTVAEDTSRNAIVLSGTTEQVAAAIDALRVLDQPVMRGRTSLRVTPTYWSASELAQTLTQVLAAEGYSMPPLSQAGNIGGVRYPIILLPVTSTNSLLVFTVSDEVLNHIRSWIARLDQPNRQTAGKNIFTYTAKHTSAESLARTISDLLQGTGSTLSAPAAADTAGATAAAGAANRATPVRAGGGGAGLGGGANRVVVDANSNTLIFNTSPENYSQVISLLTTLDQPSKSALIEVTVAEVRLTDDFNLGVEWLLNESGASGTTSSGTLGGLGLGTAGLNITRLSSLGDTRLVLNALASNNRATILSSPRITARNGEIARIQVGQEVPVITSQQTGVVGGGTNNGVLQTVQYRNTGVILSVKPSIFSGDRVDLDVTQEVSAAQSTQTGVNVSPTFATRKVETKLTLQHGSTVLLGGLISDDRTDGDRGVPFLKNLPFLGQLFRADTRTTTRTELIVLITPYIIRENNDAAEVTEAFKALVPMLSEQLGTVLLPTAPSLPQTPKPSPEKSP